MWLTSGLGVLPGDAPTLVSEIGKLLSDGMLQLLNVALTTGSGTGSPTGIITALTGGSSVVSTATADTLVAADVYAVQSSLGPRWQANARWAAAGVGSSLRSSADLKAADNDYRAQSAQSGYWRYRSVTGVGGAIAAATIQVELVMPRW